MIEQIQWLGHGSFMIQGSPQIYINPWRVSHSDHSADVILVSDHHYDHCSPVDIDKLRNTNTQIITCESVMQEHHISGAMVLRPFQSVTIGRVSIKAVPAYSPEFVDNPLYEAGLGFVISMHFYDVYYAGKTEIIPEMAQIQPDIAILPINGQQTLTVADAVNVTAQMRPRWVIPANWGTGGVGVSGIEAQMFANEAAPYAEVTLLEPNRE
jgi:L-ascorbate metabolism protein UlaG (beta-lactamase superfamily)